ncbi:MAG: MFS transporter [Clostridia bacterium]|nr:MFS transporter [Clostridia bacterium]
MRNKLSGRFWLALVLFGLMGQIAWVVENMYLNVFIYKMFNASAEDISLMVAASAIAATLTTVFIGALSDRIGKRKVFICGGYILWGISIFAFALLKVDLIESLFPAVTGTAAICVTLTIALDCIMTFFGSSANDAAYNAWLTDSTDSTNRGSAEGINSMMPLVAILAVFGGFMAFDLNEAGSWVMIFTIIGVATLLIGILGIFIIEDKCPAPSETGYIKNVFYGFMPSTVRSNPAFYFYLAAFVIFNISIQIFMPYLIIYYEVSLGMADYVLVMAPAIILASVATAFWGKVYDKKGFGFSSAFSLAWLALGYVILFIFKPKLPVFIGSLLMMCGYLSGMAVFGAKIRDLTPEDKAGRLQGVRIFSQVLLPGIIGPFIGKTVLANAEKIVNNDGTESFVPNENIFLAALVPIAILAILLLVASKYFNKPRLCKVLKTPFEDDTSSDWTEYPRPQMKRDSYMSLCGEWELSLRQFDEAKPLGAIKVPFPPESRISGIEQNLTKLGEFIYRKKFVLPPEMSGKRIIIHFGAVDQYAYLYVNDFEEDSFVDASVDWKTNLPYEIDITDYLKEGDNIIELRGFDILDHDSGWGKQCINRGGMWYTPISGIWQAVWLEAVPKNYIRDIKMTPSLDSVRFKIEGGEDEKIITLKDGKQYRFGGDEFELKIDDPHLWTPEDPYLYVFTLESGEDKIESYFALRTVGTAKIGGKSFITLNEKPYFFHGLLDQGYYSDGIYTPATPEGYKYDILKMKELGFNMLRKHIKVEPELFYYYCDKYGMIVFQDMVNSGKYNFLIDTALPTIGLRKGITHRASDLRRASFKRETEKTIDALYNHPSVIYYTIFNEGWGQFDADENYRRLKALDPSRIWDATSGWFAEKESDVTSDHVYFKKLDLKNDPDRPMVLSEFGGYSCKIEGHSFNLDKTYGYSFFKDTESFGKALKDLYMNEVIPMIDRGLCATVYTQVSDVEDETNGLVTYDRQVVKVNKADMLEISKTIDNRFYSQF